MRGIERNLDKFRAAGIKPVAISVDPPDVSQKMAETNSLTFTVLSDPSLTAIKSYDLVHEGMGEDGSAISRPAEFLIDSSGTVRWVDLTENYWVRVTPEQMLEAISTLP